MTSSPQDPSVTPGAAKALKDLEIPGRKSEKLPEPPAKAGETLWGINHGAVVDNFPNNGLQLYIPAWATMSAGDSVSVLLENAPVTTRTITEDEVNQRVTAFVEARHLEGGRYILRHRVSRFGQADETSGETHIWVKLDRPGGKDPDGNATGHQNLILSMPEDIVEFGVDADDAKAGVPVTILPYPGMAHRDLIRLSWGGVIVKHEVEPEQVDKEIEILVKKEEIEEAGDSGDNGLAVTFEVNDIVDNRSEDWSAEIRIMVKTVESRLPSPIVVGTVGYVLDLDTLGNAPVTVQVWVSDDRKMTKQLYKSLTPEQAARLRASMGKETFSNLGEIKGGIVKGDKIVVRMTGTTLDSQRVIYEAPEVFVTNVPQTYEIQVPNAVVRQLAQTQAVFSYRVVHEEEGKPNSISKGRFISVIGEAVRMAAPVARDAQQGAINPDLPQTTVQIPWDDSMAEGDQLTLKWIGTQSDFSIYDPELTAHIISQGEANRKDPIDFTVPGMHLQAIEGGTLELYFILAKDVAGTIVNRESARATTLNIGEPRAELTKPWVDGIVEGVMDPDLKGTTLTAPVYAGMAISDEVHYLWHGSGGGDVQDSLKINSFTLNKSVVFDVDQEDISDNNGGTVEASYWVIRASGRRTDSDVLTFSVGQPVVLDPPVISSVRDSKGQEIANNGYTVDTSVTLSGTASPGKEVEIFDDSDSQGSATVDASGKWTLTVSTLSLTTHAMKAIALDGSDAESAVWTFTVQFVAPTITSITNEAGGNIRDGGDTNFINVTVRGRARVNFQVEVFDADFRLGTVTADANGEWLLPVNYLSTGPHAIKAKALYGSGDESDLYTITVVIPYGIDSIRDSSGRIIPDRGITDDPRLTLSGTGRPGLFVLISYDGRIFAQTYSSAAGFWTVDWTFTDRREYNLSVTTTSTSARTFTLI